ncbi:hypothetical protein QWZ10_24355 [Paracoccus cavernae]|uniref:Uncharacterized protein n=1 Tax=Paracoccus cavernae TaxID=1571207 RepID=A0ABT8DCE5_9RHOB|nr:hypothetical protein [Paracoccus cavernae]
MSTSNPAQFSITGSQTGHNEDIRQRLGLRPIINVSGTMTALGASIMQKDAIAAMAEIAPEWIEMDALQARSAETIARLTGSDPASSRHAARRASA